MVWPRILGRLPPPPPPHSGEGGGPRAGPSPSLHCLAPPFGQTVRISKKTEERQREVGLGGNFFQMCLWFGSSGPELRPQHPNPG